MKIAICDDEDIFSEQISKLISKTLENKSECDIHIFKSGEELISQKNNHTFDIIFLDIEMNGMTGIETAKQIRKYDTDAIIVFFTSHQEFAIEGYEVNAFRFLVKNQPEYIYEKQFQSIFDEYSQKHKIFEIPSKSRVQCLHLEEIVYFEVIDKKIIIHSTHSECEYTGKLADVEIQLQNDNFIRTHKSFLVNIPWINNINKNDITMKNNDTIPMSRSHKKNVVEKYISYMTGR